MAPSWRQPGVILSIVILIVVLIAGAYFAALAYWPVKVLTIHINPMPVMKKVLLQGEIVPIMWDFTKHSDVVGTVHVRFVNDISYQLSQTLSGAIRKGKYKRVAYNIAVPPSLPPGYYRVELTIVYPVNFLKRVIVRSSTEQFTVRKF